MQNHLTDFERAEYYRKRYLSRGTLIIIYSILFFCLGFLTAKSIYKDSKEYNFEWKVSTIK